MTCSHLECSEGAEEFCPPVRKCAHYGKKLLLERGNVEAKHYASWKVNLQIYTAHFPEQIHLRYPVFEINLRKSRCLQKLTISWYLQQQHLETRCPNLSDNND
jgi:hypothetical protein